MKRLLFPIALTVFPISVAAAEISSVYSELDLKKCEKLALQETEDEGGEWRCRGIRDYDVRVWEGDLRSFVGFGRQAPAQCAAMQTFGAFNSLGPRVEWRMRDGKPFATILRWFTESSADDGAPVKQNWLVVTKLDGADACHIAYVDTKYTDANEVARQRADERAQTFDCAKDMPEIFSARGGSATDYASGMPCPGGPYREE
ncbi:hypothetical protein G5V57_10205 [Nordella sp. HKS 07]|uniref:hypothetical protein n=1 Tax=Nordella sp. HKS 07 TaxID=2712222 RepID=UPI0013E1761C|nr:hypothetical protein [Nordella sp. HKS 07]QIG48063.1 hypothetical protein G5V57_10205 [Nordella sp. HKS 07]